jgi:hypothetical protein
MDMPPIVPFGYGSERDSAAAHALDRWPHRFGPQLAAALTAAQESLQHPPSSGPSLDGGTAADAAGLGMALAPTLPHTSATLAMAEVARLHISTLIKPGEFREPPQDPPPDHLDRTA